MKLLYFLLLMQFIFLTCKPNDRFQIESNIQTRFEDIISKSQFIKTASLLVHSEKLSIHLVFEKQDPSSTVLRVTDSHKPFHIASVGKMFTSVLIFQAIEEGKLQLDSKVFQILSPSLLDRLFVWEGRDYKEVVTIQHLLEHTSGVEDYFESEDLSKNSVMQSITSKPDKFWSPEELLRYTKENQHPVNRPGAQFHYSDTGYILLGLVLEKIFQKEFHRILSERIFQPLGMKDSYLHLRSKPQNQNPLPLSQIFLRKANVTNNLSISADWAGGGIVSTVEDLLSFHKALVQGKLISPNHLQELPGNHKFHDGIYYGFGLMTLRFGDMSFFMPSEPDVFGHSGILGTMSFYSPSKDAYIICNVGSTDDMEKTFEMLFWILRDLGDLQSLQEKTN